MKLRLSPSSTFCLLSLCLILVHPWLTAQAKPIRLRTELIETEDQRQGALQPQADSAASATKPGGLFLLQFDAPPTAAQQADLRALGVQLLRYVPEDAFLVKLNGVPPGKLRALGYIRWVGPYRSDHKLHPRLTKLAQSASPSGTIDVTVMAASQATSAELTELHSLFTKIIHQSRLRQGIIVRGKLAQDRLAALSELDSVLWIEQAPKRKLVDEAASKLVGGDDGQIATPTATQQLGFTGAGVTVCVADTGLDSGDTNAMHPDLSGRVIGFQYYGDNITDGSDGYGHGTHCAGIVAGNAATGETDPDYGMLYGLGVAPESKLLVQRIFDDDANQADPFPSDDQLTSDAVRSGADIGSNSWGNDVQGDYDTDAAQFDELVRDADPGTPGDQPYILEFSSGNAGPDSQTVGSPATAKNVIATGASQNVPGIWPLTYGLYADGPDTMADFSSRGPCADGRIKPDLVAPGTWIASAASSAAFNEDAIAWTPIDEYYVYMGGTSMSGPHAAGAAAVFVQYYKSTHTNAVPSPALTKAALINSAVELDQLNGGPGPIPNYEEGWGRIALPNIIFTNQNTAPRYFQYVDQTVPLTNGQVEIRHVLVRSSGQPLKITLAYTDVAGFPGALPALVNDLDLEVVAPDGTVYRGNQFAGSDSFPNAPTADDLNNVEAVHLASPAPGDYLVRVRGTRVVQDARLDTPAIDQDFALVISADLARPNAGSLLLDRGSYTAPDTIRLTAFDLPRAGSTTVSVLLKSSTEPNGEIITLHSAGNYGAFTGAVATVLGSASNDGALEVHHNDSLEADYVDSFGISRVVTASADLVAPAISGLTITTNLGIITVTWQTSEPANSIVRYSTNLTFSAATTNTTLTTEHLVRLSKLLPGQAYSLYTVSSDPASNSTTNNNSGAFFHVVGILTPTVLLVDAYEPVTGSPTIPDSSYTNALAASGFRYAHWKVSQRGSPDLSDLQAFPVVLWRLIDDILNYGVDEDGLPDPAATNNTLTAQQQVMIANYLNSGGSFCMSSMSILSALGNVPFRKNVLRVGGFKQNPDPPSPCNCDEDFGVPAILGAPADPLTSGINTTLDYSSYPEIDLFDMYFGPDFSDTFTPSTNATPILFESASGKPCGMKYPRVGIDSPGRVAFLSFPLDTVPESGSAPNNRATLLANLLNFLTPGNNGNGSIFLDSTTYTIPDRVTVEVGDSDLVGTRQTQVLFSTSGGPNTALLTLKETGHPGLFRGVLTLVATNAATNQLVVHHGDVITAQYYDASNNRNAATTATIDTVPPVITQVSVATHFGDATVTWNTSKPADSLVQYGESVRLGRTAFDAASVTNHSVTLSSLAANRGYYFQVTSRDAAGNATTDDNQGALYTFTTEKAPGPPWSDSLEAGAEGWTVVPDSSGTDRNWELAKPNSSLEQSAHSGTNAWCSNPNGANFNFLESSFLYSPFIDLSGVIDAKLTFWHSFDASSGLEFLELGVSTNSATAPADVPTLISFTGQTSGGWKQETVKLDAFVGKTIQVVWYYAGVSIGPPPPGWMVDDVSITGTPLAAGGTITITKNLSQGTWTLHGPVNQRGSALSTIISNAPAGPYTIQFGDVPFYQTPPALSNSLTSAGTLNLTANYSFLDVNQNDMSDSWEKYFFGAALTNRNQSTDTDGDGMTDYAEFLAGTDPTNAASKLVFLGASVLTNQLVRFSWLAIPGRLYQVQAASLAAQSLPKLSGSLNNAAGGFKLHVEARTNLAYTLQTSTNLANWSSIHTNSSGGNFDWTDATFAQSIRRYYRTVVAPESATNLPGWTPVSDWIRASRNPTSFTTSATNAPSRVYRVEVKP